MSQLANLKIAINGLGGLDWLHMQYRLFVYIVNAKDQQLVCMVWPVLGPFCFKCQPFFAGDGAENMLT